MLGPIATALGEVFQFQVKATKESGLSAMDLRTLLDWFIAYQLRGVDGVTEINAHGGELKTYQVEVDPDKLATYRLSMTELLARFGPTTQTWVAGTWYVTGSLATSAA